MAWSGISFILYSDYVSGILQTDSSVHVRSDDLLYALPTHAQWATNAAHGSGCKAVRKVLVGEPTLHQQLCAKRTGERGNKYELQFARRECQANSYVDLTIHPSVSCLVHR